jgi:GNAT superfamily N-acetyltransferase
MVAPMYRWETNVPVLTFFMDENSIIDCHWDEVANYKNAIELDPDIEKYVALENAGVLKNVCVYDEDRLIGYSVLFIQPHLHYCKDLFAYVDVIYLHPDYRGSTLGVKLVKKTEQLARECGASVVTFHTKPLHPAIDKVLVKFGYGHIENIFGKCLKE